MAYSDKEIIAFTQVAYMNGIEKLVDALHDKEPSKKIMMSDLYEKLDKTSQEKYNYIKNVLGCDIDKWIIVGTHDRNNKNGFSAYIIETSPGNAVVAFRGSDSMTSYSSVKNDWVKADIGLVNSTCTNQQAEVDVFLASKKDTLEGYDNITMTGHSLGGNLAEYATIMSSEYGLDDNVKQCVSMDGPGFSDEFIELHRDKILNMSGKMKHHRWSCVGTMLNDLPGVSYDYVQVSNDANAFDNEKYNCLSRHDTKYLVLDDETEMLKIGKQDIFSKFTNVLSSGIDHMPKIVGDVLVTVVGSIWIGAMWTKENMFVDGNLTPTGYAIMAESVVVVSIFGLPKVEMAVLAIVVALIVVLAVAFFTELAFDLVELAYDLFLTALDVFCDMVEKMYNWAKEEVNQIKNAVISIVNKAKSWWNSSFNNGYKYANNNPEIKVDTYKLTTYAGRLQAVNRRLSNLDSRIDKLYWKVGLLDLLKLMKSDYKIGYSSRINSCANYLNNTASDFNNAEQSIANNL